MTALRRAPVVAVENGAFALVKIAALPLLIGLGVAHGIFIAWAIPILPTVLVVNLYIFRVALPRHAHMAPSGDAETFDVAAVRPTLVKFLTLDYLSVVLNFGVIRFLPLIVVGVLGSRANAYFYITFTIITAVDMLVYNVGTSLTVEAAQAEDRLGEFISVLARRLVLWFALGLAVLILAAPIVLLPFGASYSANGTTLLRLLAASSAFRAVIVLFAATARVRGRANMILATNAALAVLLVVSTVSFAESVGLNGVGLAWLMSHAVVAVAVFPTMRRLLRDSSPAFATRADAAVSESVTEPSV